MRKGLWFSGQGAQMVGMGRSFHENSGLARSLFARADDALGWSISEIAFNGPEVRLTETRHCQPALFVVGMVGYLTLRERIPDLECSVALGLSLGELTALAAAEAFDFETGVRVVAERARLMQEACEVSDGTMASLIGGSLDAARAICEEHDIDVANLLSPGQVVISGERSRVEAASAAAKASGHFKMVVPLKVAGAYHSRLMEPARSRFGSFLNSITITSPRIPVYSNTSGETVETPDAIRNALTAQIVSPVLWETCARNAAENQATTTFYECGPSATLAGLAKRINRDWKVIPIAEYADLPSAADSTSLDTTITIG